MATPQSPPIDLLSQWSNADYWRKLCPYLTISSDEKSLADNDKNIEGCDDVNVNEQLLERLIDDGYALLDSKICNDSLREKLARGISDMEVQHTLPATFILLYDETWKLAAESHRLLLQQSNGDNNATNQSILHPNNMAFNFDMLAWHIDPKMNQAGFSPHRDRQPDSLTDLENSFYADGQAKYITHWIAVSSTELSLLFLVHLDVHKLTLIASITAYRCNSREFMSLCYPKAI